MKDATKAAISISFNIAENGSPSLNMLVVNLDEKVDGNSRADARLKAGLLPKLKTKTLLQILLLTLSRLNEMCKNRENRGIKDVIGCVRR